jgi:NAD(P)-dependent dehydrogenase (short-subunit alcohol dehydrogenase family)
MADALTGKVALVTGGGTGIGLAIARALATSGALVTLVGRRLEVLEAAAQSIVDEGGEATALVGDVARSDQAAHVIERTVKAFGKLHVLVNNAAVAHGGSLADTTDEHIDAMIDTNLRGVIHITRAALPHLCRHRDQGGGAIVNISSSVTFDAVPNFSIYSATKAALEMLTRCWARELAGSRVRVNAISPGVVETPMQAMLVGPDAVDEVRAAFAEQTPLGRIGRPDDIARLALYLAGPGSEWMTGSIIPIDGGLSLGPPVS